MRFEVCDAALMDRYLAVRREVFIDEQGVSEELELDAADDLPTTVHLVGLDGEDAVASGRLLDVGSPTVLIGRVAVRSARRGTGLGRRIMAALEEVARDRATGDFTLELHAQEHAAGFYESLGYAVASEPYLEAGIRHVTMRKAMTAS
ncbi:GNAT family N-acetyltransferase [Granulicoccus phenolivorans]|uniref:GNAT family N-acetyltransferase n=1 Tax=Granulicoccus phenolivorans TaxID=266854 RepID=UPI00047BB5D7|nr:GNAT family N-acetyltransferase [Granulicoccus phenolivorans]